MFKMKSAILFIVTVSLASISQTTTQCITDGGNIPANVGKLIHNFNNGQLNFTADLLLTLSQLSPYENVFVSPHSIYNALLLAYFGSQKETKNAFEKALYLGWTANKEDVMRAYRYQTQVRTREQNTNNNSGLEFSSANRLFFSPNVPIKACMKDFFNNELETLDFQRQTEASRRQINAWVENVTKHMIKELLAPGTVTTQTNVVLANAAYFKGKWETKFNEAHTAPDYFYPILLPAVKVPMMSVTGQFKLSQNAALGCRILDLPYVLTNNTQTSMLILMPVDFQVETVLRRLTPELLAAALDESDEHEVDLKMPKFIVEKTLELRPLLAKMGLEQIFSPNADFSDFSEKTNVGFDEGVHKAKIEVDENGSTAAAATAVFGFRSGFTAESEKIECNYPFVYLIYDHKEKVALFAGVYRGPE